MSVESALTVIAQRIAAVPGVGPNVFTRTRIIDDWGAFMNTVFVDDVTGASWWEVKWTGDAARVDEAGLVRTHNIEIDGFRSARETIDGVFLTPSEPVFRDVVRAIAEEFRTDIAQSETGRKPRIVGDFFLAAPASVSVFETGDFGTLTGEATSHHARIVLQVEERPGWGCYA